MNKVMELLTTTPSSSINSSS